MTENGWQVVGRMVKARRERLGLRQEELRHHGGPGVATVSKIERAAQGNFPLRTQQQVETALGWSRGTIEQVLEAVAAGEWDDLGPAWEADLVEHDVPDLTQTGPAAAPVRRAAELSDPELLAELTYRMRQYADAAGVAAPPTSAGRLIVAELARRGKNLGWLMDATGLEVDELVPILEGQRVPSGKDAARLEKALGWAPGALTDTSSGNSGDSLLAQLRRQVG